MNTDNTNATEDTGLSKEDIETIAHLRKHRDEIPARLAAMTTRCGMMYITKRLARYKIGTGQVFVLIELLNKDGVSQEDMRCALKMDKGTITRAMQRLEDGGYIARSHDTQDRRVVRVFVTDKARALEMELFTVLYEWNQGVMKGTSAEDQRIAVSVLQRMAGNAEAMAHRCGLRGIGLRTAAPLGQDAVAPAVEEIYPEADQQPDKKTQPVGGRK